MRQRGRPGTGQIRRQLRADGLTTFSLRVRAYGKRHTIRLGTELDGWTEARAEIELANVCAQIRAGTWSPPGKHTETGEVPTFHEYASAWLRRRVAEGLGENTRKDYLWRLSSHLLPFLASYRIDEITDDVVEAFKEHKLDERATIIAAEDAGEQIRDRNGRARRALSNESINKLLVLLTRVLEPAVRRGWLPHNPAASVQRLRVPRRKGAILEADELESLIIAARPRARCATGTSERRRLVRELRDPENKLSWREIGDTARDRELDRCLPLSRRTGTDRPRRPTRPGRRARLWRAAGQRGGRAERCRHRPRAPQDLRPRQQDRRWRA